MQHIFEFVIEKKEGIEDMTPITSMYVTQSSRLKKVAVLVQEEAIKYGWIEAKDIKNVYLHQLR